VHLDVEVSGAGSGENMARDGRWLVAGVEQI
jgi:hypothetical protein